MNQETPPPTGASIVLSNGSPLDRLVTVAMPGSLPELQHLAAQYFGHSGCLRLYRNGLHLLYHPTQMKHLADGDVVVVRRSEHRPMTSGQKDASTHQSDFVWHRPKTSARGCGNDWISTLSETTHGRPLDGKSRYAEDYVEHPLSREAPFQPPAALHLHDDKTGTTSYAEHFPWRNNKTPRRKTGNDYNTSLATDARFDGATSYNLDYKKPPLEYSGAARALGSDYLSSLSEDQQRAPFDGCSTYYADYKKFDKGRQLTFKPRGQELRKEPFLGSSEYRRQYLGPSKSTNKDNIFIGREKIDSQGSVTGQPLREHAAQVARETGLLTPGMATAVA